MTMTHYDSTGKPVGHVSYRAEQEERTYDVGEILDRGIPLPFEKGELDGQTVRVVGIKGPEDFQLGSVYFLLVRLLDQPADMDAYGVLFPAESVPVRIALQMAENGKLPFDVTLRIVKSQANKGYTYWSMERPANPALPAADSKKETKKA